MHYLLKEKVHEKLKLALNFGCFLKQGQKIQVLHRNTCDNTIKIKIIYEALP